MWGRKFIRALALAAALATGAAPAARAQDAKPELLVEHVVKGGFSARDREIAAEFLARRRGELPEAPARAEARVAAGFWSDNLAPYARSVPKRLERELAPAPEGAVMVLFNRTLLLVRSDDGRVLDRVYPE